MSDGGFDLDGWLSRIGHAGPGEPGLSTLGDLIAAHSAAIPFENIDPFLGRTPKLDLASLRTKMLAGGLGGYCFEQNTLLRAGLIGLGFRVTSLVARVIIGATRDAFTPATHMLLRVDLPEGPFLADVGFGHQTPTAPLVLQPHLEQPTPHETMRLTPAGEEFVLEAETWGCLAASLPLLAAFHTGHRLRGRELVLRYPSRQLVYGEPDPGSAGRGWPSPHASQRLGQHAPAG